MTIKTGALVLAAGKGTRMHSVRPKVLYTLLEEPMLGYVYAALDQVVNGGIWTVVGYLADEIAKVFPDRASGFALQAEQLGTGHALKCAMSALAEAGLDRLLVVNGDTPLLRPEAVRCLIEQAADADLAFLSIAPKGENEFGRVLRDAQGQVTGVVEVKDYDPARHGELPVEANAGVYVFSMRHLPGLLADLRNDNKKGEYYITDLIGMAVTRGLRVTALCQGDAPDLMGVNSPLELVRAEEALRADIVDRHLKAGALIRQADSVRIGPKAVVEPGAEIVGPTEIYGTSRIARGSCVQSHCVLRSATVLTGALVRSFCHLEQAEIGPDCQAGPFARLRPGTVLEEGARVGNFVEAKKARLRKGAKAGHLTYLGDADIGAATNVGAGTITCNYDGKNKHVTTIGERVFIGSNTALVAPVRIGDDALIGAGSVITKDVAPGELAIARERQKNLPRKIKGS